MIFYLAVPERDSVTAKLVPERDSVGTIFELHCPRTGQPFRRLKYLHCPETGHIYYI